MPTAASTTSEEWTRTFAEGSNVPGSCFRTKRSVELGVCIMQLFHFFDHVMKSDDFSLRYGDISIFKMATVRHLGIVYNNTRPLTKSQLLVAAACQMSCQSDTQI